MIPHTSTAPHLDGCLDEPVWSQAVVITNFTQVLPVEGAPPGDRTEVRLLFDADHLYIAIRCFDRDPAGILAKKMQRDDLFLSDDVVELAFDTFLQRREGYFFAVNPAGARAEGLIESFNRRNRLWDTLWRARARIDAEGWTVEIEIPFTSLSFDPRKEAWGFNVERIIRRRQERVRWTGISRARPVTSLPDAGEIRGLTGLNQGLGLEIKPAISVKRHDPAGAPATWELRPSVDATYYLTPSLKANATINTDFAEAEADQRIVNLTRFPLFFPEKRDFFLQDASLFTFGGLRQYPLTPYYSRRLGLDPDGAPVDIQAGGRLTGRVNGTSLALLGVRQAASETVSTKNLLVGRLSTRILDESDIGALFTYGDPLSEGDSALAGVDFNYLNSDLGDGRSLAGHLWAMGSTSDRLDGEDYAVGGVLDYPNEPLGLGLSIRQIGDTFDPALGFVRRRGVREYAPSAQYIWRVNSRCLRSVNLRLDPTWITDLDHRLVEEDHDIPSLSLYTPRLDRLTAMYAYDRDVLDEGFDIRPDIRIPSGDYVNDQVYVGAFSSDARPVGLDLSWRGGNYYDGTRFRYGTALNLRPIRYVTARFSYEFNDIELPAGDFTLQIATVRLELAATPELTWSTLAQYDNLSGNVGINSRIRWTYRPGHDLHLVVNQGYFRDAGRLDLQSTEVAVKLVAAFRF